MWPCLWPCQTRLHTAVIARIARCRRPVESRAGVVELECAPETVLNMRQEIYHKPAEHFVGDGPSLKARGAAGGHGSSKRSASCL